MEVNNGSTVMEKTSPSLMIKVQADEGQAGSDHQVKHGTGRDDPP